MEYIYKIVKSPLTAFIAGVWAFYCYTLGEWDGTAAIVFLYFYSVWTIDDWYKKGAGAANTRADK